MDFNTSTSVADRVGRRLGRGLASGASWAIRRWRLVLLSYMSVIVCGSVLVYTTIGKLSHPSQPRLTLTFLLDYQDMHHLEPRRWGFNQRPMTNKCYAQERTAMLLALFLGSFGVDQFYAHHWPLAVFKLLTLGGMGLWSLIDMVLWIVGGIYGTPGCPGGSSTGWQY